MPPSNKRLKMSQDEEEVFIINEKPSSSKGNSGDWRDNANGFKERHKHAMKQGILTDVSFAVGPQEEPLSAHKMILALASPVFEVMFYGSLKETNDVISIPDIMPRGFQLLLDYIYTDEMEFKNETEALYAWFAANKYCLSHMKDKCCSYLSQCELTNSNVWIILENSLFLNSPNLADKCLGYLKKNIDNAMNAPDFLEISGETLKKILSMESLCIKEVTLLKGVVRWSKEKIKSDTEESLRQFLGPFLVYIRFGCISQMEFVDFIDQHKDIISDSDALAILKYMTDNRTYSLPDWCSFNVHPRRGYERGRSPIKKMTLNIRSYVIKPTPTPRSSEIVSYRSSENQLFHNSRNERLPHSSSGGSSRRQDDDADSYYYSPSNRSGPSRRQDEDHDRHYYSTSMSEDEDDVDNISRLAVAASNMDSDDSISSYSSSSSSAESSFSS